MANTAVAIDPVEAAARQELARILVPAVGERVVVVPQHSFHLTDLAPRGVVGCTVAEIDPLTSHNYGSPYWADYQPTKFPYLGSALLLVRDGIVRRGPQNWDSQ